jgi:hypothetical protein
VVVLLFDGEALPGPRNGCVSSHGLVYTSICSREHRVLFELGLLV